MNSLLEFDRQYKGIICGVDEAGRGPWAGPVVAAAVILDPEKVSMLGEVDDSKKISEKKREGLFQVVINACLTYAIAGNIRENNRQVRHFVLHIKRNEKLHGKTFAEA